MPVYIQKLDGNIRTLSPSSESSEDRIPSTIDSLGVSGLHFFDYFGGPEQILGACCIAGMLMEYRSLVVFHAINANEKK
uniref:Autophagy-related protein 101 n=1 Tax=Rhizophora mucronata TaxID=61149 RepID=A0A2P2KGE7_RHIMU